MYISCSDDHSHSSFLTLLVYSQSPMECVVLALSSHFLSTDHSSNCETSYVIQSLVYLSVCKLNNHTWLLAFPVQLSHQEPLCCSHTQILSSLLLGAHTAGWVILHSNHVDQHTDSITPPAPSLVRPSTVPQDQPRLVWGHAQSSRHSQLHSPLTSA